MFQYFNLLGSAVRGSPGTNNFLGVMAFNDTSSATINATDFDPNNNAYIASGNTILKVNNDGVVEWSKSLPNVTYYSIAYGNDGYIYASGKETSLTYERAFLVKYNITGSLVLQNAYYIYSSSGNLNHFYSIDADASGNMYLLGYSLVSSTSVYYVLKIDSVGTLLWQKSIDARFISSESARPSTNYLRVDTSANVHLVLTKNHPTTTRACQVVSKIDTNGNVTWSRYFGQTLSTLTGGANLSTGCINFDSSGNVFIAGVFSTTRPGDPSYTPSQVFLLAKYNSSGTLQWYARTSYAAIGSASISTDCLNITFDSSSNIYVSVIGANASVEPIGYVYKFDSSGNHLNGFKMDTSNSPYEDYVKFANVNTDNTITFVGSSIDDTGIGFQTALHEDIVFHRVPIDFTKTGTYNLNAGSINYSTFTSYSIGKTWGSDTNTAVLNNVTWNSANTSLSDTLRPLQTRFLDI